MHFLSFFPIPSISPASPHLAFALALALTLALALAVVPAPVLISSSHSLYI
jgi:hypothetical protein